MNTKQSLFRSVKLFIEETESSMKQLNDQLAIVKLERDMYKEMCKRGDECAKNTAYISIYSVDNGEGVDTETCIGVFNKKSLAMQSIYEICKNNEFDTESFRIETFDVDKELIPGEIIKIIQRDEEAHCEVSTTIIGVQSCTSIDDDYYTVDYKINTVYFIEA